MNLHEQIEILNRVVMALSAQLRTRDVSSMRQDLDAGEPEVAYHHLCTQLIEYGVPVTPSIQDDLELVGRELKVDPKYCRLLTVEPPSSG